MKIYVQHNDGEPLYPIGFDEVAGYITPEDWCEVDKHSYELEMDHSHTVHLSFAALDVNHEECEKNILSAIKCVLADRYGSQHYPDNWGKE